MSAIEESRLPVTPVFIGESPMFMRRMTSMVEALPSIFQRLSSLNLRASFSGLKGLRFVEQSEKGSTTMGHYDRGRDILSVYPMAFRAGSRIDMVVYAALGLRHFELNLSSQDKLIWKKKFVYPKDAVIDRLQDFLSREGHPTFRAVLNRFSTAVDRLQVIHVLNTLLDNNVKPDEMKFIDLREYPPTRSFCRSMTPFSLTPLLSAYRSDAMGMGMDRYDIAFAEYCSENGRIPTAEMSAEESLVEIFKLVTL
jgi:hypothetical protein